MTVAELVESHIDYAECIALDACRGIPRFVYADDLYGAAYEALVDAAGTFSASRGTFRTWCYRRIRTAVLREAWWIVNWRRDYRIGQNCAPNVSLEEWRDVMADPRAEKAAFFRDLARDYVREKLDALEEPDRTVLRLRYFEGCTEKEGTRRIGCCHDSWWAWGRRGLDRLWEELAHEESELDALLESGPRKSNPDVSRILRKRTWARDNWRESLDCRKRRCR